MAQAKPNKNPGAVMVFVVKTGFNVHLFFTIVLYTERRGWIKQCWADLTRCFLNRSVNKHIQCVRLVLSFVQQIQLMLIWVIDQKGKSENCEYKIFSCRATLHLALFVCLFVHLLLCPNFYFFIFYLYFLGG